MKSARSLSRLLLLAALVACAAFAQGKPKIETKSNLPDGRAGIPYLTNLEARGGDLPYIWEITAGSLPQGLTLLNSTGTIAGIPTTAGEYRFTVQVRSGEDSDSQQFRIVIASLQPLSVQTNNLANGTVGAAYSADLAASGGTEPYAWSVSAGSLPAGLTVNPSSGVISGTPTTAGVSDFSATVTDATNQTATRQLRITVNAPAVSLSTTTLPGATVGQAYTANLSASGGSPPYGWTVSAGNLPSGLSLSANGAITGTPTTAGNSTFTVRVTDASNQSASAPLQITVSAPPAPTISTTSLPAGTVRQAYAATLAASGGKPPYAWTVSAGTLPAGLSLAAEGALSGTPTTAGVSTFTVRVTDAATQSSTRQLQITVNAPPAPTITSGTLPAGTVGQAYSATLTATGGTPPYSWTASGGALPEGVSLGANGAVSGTPTAVGSFSFTANVTDAANQSSTRQLQITINPPALTISTSSLPGGTVGQSYARNLSASGGTPPFAWAVSAGTLPAGLALAADGAISGTPTTAGASTFSVRVTDAASQSATRQLQITISAPAAPSISTNALPVGTVGQAYTGTLTATGGTPPYTWTASAGTFPQGLTLNENGRISGSPTTAGTFDFTARVTDSANQSATRQLQLKVNAPAAPSISTTTLAPGTVGQPYTGSIAASGGTPPYSWTAPAGTFPPGLALGADGAISGTPTTAGDFDFTARVTDAANQSATRQLRIVINAAIVPLSITTTAVPIATVGAEYNQTLSATGGRPPYAWAVGSGSLPAGLTLSAAGRISGTPSAAGSFPVILRVSDADSRTAERPVTLTVAASVAIPACPVATGLVGTSYASPLSATGGATPYSWSVTSGQLPPGLSLASSTGVVSGIPILSGAFNFTLNVSDAGARSATRSCTVTIASALQILTEVVPDATTRAPYSFTLRGVGGTAPYRWTTVAGSLPPGLLLDESLGAITGQPAQQGRFTFTVQLTDASGGSAQRTYTAAVATGIAIPSCPPAVAMVGRAYEGTLAAAGGQGPYTWSIASGSLPAGVTLATDTGVLTGPPTTAGTAEFAIRVSDQATSTADRACAIQVVPELTITTSALPAAEVGVPYNSSLEATGGAPPRDWTISAGALPAGLSLNSATGQVGGTPSASGTFRITARVADSAGNQRERQFDVIVGGGFVITACPTPSAVIGEAYSSSLSLTGGDAPIMWAIASGALPGGLTLGAQTGAVAGAPADAGTFEFTIRASDASSKITTRSCSINVNPSALRITAPGRLTDAILGTAYMETLQATGGRGPYGWSVAEGTFPPGFELGATGTLSGTPSTVGVYRFTVRVADADRGIATSVVELRVLPARAPNVSFGDLPDIIAPAQQPRVRVTIDSAYPTPLRGRLQLRFTPDPGLNVDDPSIRFVDGTRTVDFEIPADTTEAVFAVPQFALQTGSVAGIINLDVSLTSGDFDVTPSPAPAKSLRVDRTAPLISSVRVNTTAGGFEVIVSGFSTTREVTSATFQFTPAAGSRLDASQITIQTDAAARQWFGDTRSFEFGGQFTFAQPFTVQNATLSEVGVTLTNAQGTSQPVRARFP